MTTPTMIDLVQNHLFLQDVEHRAKIAAAKTNFEYLLAVGVITTCDDEMDRAMRYSYIEEQRKLAGVSHNLFEAALDFARMADSLISSWLSIGMSGETPAEHWVRVREAFAKAEPAVAPGKKKACKHNETRTARGIISTYSRDPLLSQYTCCRCGTVVTVSTKRAEPTPAAVEALALFDRFANVNPNIDPEA